MQTPGVQNQLVLSHSRLCVDDQNGDIPQPRFGHTVTFIGRNRVVLFGGATGDSGRYTITADTYSLDISTNTWYLLKTSGVAPTARAAHATACVEQGQLVVYGGAMGGGSLSSEELLLLDFREEHNAQWMLVPISPDSPNPGKRYGHSMVFSKPLLILFGGNDGKNTLNDVWILDVQKAPFTWICVCQNVESPTNSPTPRVYHAADICREGPAAGMMVVFGGRQSDNTPLADIWGLRQHRDGRWDWVPAPTKRGKPPDARFQHFCHFYFSKLLIVGGRGLDVNAPLSIQVYDTEICAWSHLPGIFRFRHASWLIGSYLFCFGGFDHKKPSTPVDQFIVLDVEKQLLLALDSPVAVAATSLNLKNKEQSSNQSSTVKQPTILTPISEKSKNPPNKNPPPTSAAKLGRNVHISHDQDYTHQITTIDIDSLAEEGRKLAPKINPTAVKMEISELDGVDIPPVVTFTIDQLMRPNTWTPDVSMDFFLSPGDISILINSALQIFKNTPNLIHLRAPIKVYGDLHGQFIDLMRMFSRYKCPSDSPNHNGDIDYMDYLFLGDFVDRGAFSLEVICLLLALKVKYPKQVHLIRGNHEDMTINSIYGFKEECRRRLHEDPEAPNSIYHQFNLLFEWLPLAAVIDDQVLCIHGGIGGSIKYLSDLNRLYRPIRVAQIPTNEVEQIVTDLLWSDPSDNDGETGVVSNDTRDPDGSGHIVKFGPDVVDEFLENNPPLCMIIRAHECVMDGFERFAGGKLITVFSATDYCGHHKNAGALLFIRRDMTIVPKLIYPAQAERKAVGDQSPQAIDTWDMNIRRPSTPPRPSRKNRK